MMKTYKAPWSRSLVVTSVLATLLILGLVLGISFLPLPKNGREVVQLLNWMPVLLVPVCALFTIRGYTITPDSILVHRLLWATRLPRAGLVSAESVPHAMRGSIRTCGNGGFYSFSGFYWSKTLKSYRAYVTEPGRTVILRYDRRTVVVSPERPEDFVRDLFRLRHPDAVP